jgi:lipopolysaccharide transport system ATP-binding protein
MSDIVVSARDLGKKYTIGHKRLTGYRTLRDEIVSKARAVGQRLLHPLSPNRELVDLEEFWALRHVAFDVRQGERLGIIGRNGAGKSTLLKLLSRITEPSEGRITLRGRVASLLEVGTGFHPELSGRENVYLNGAILGMGKAEIRHKFDEIVAFAEIEKFLDTPVKRYSSGMFVRLAFAVAAHLEPEVLIVDEVLAVGDIQFQKKCLGKMEDVAQQGRTVLFVSHNMAAVSHLCTRGIFLKNGTVQSQGPIGEVVANYLDSVQADDTDAPDLAERKDRSGNGAVRLTSFEMRNANGAAMHMVQSGMEVEFVFGYRCDDPASVRGVDLGISLHRLDGTTLSVAYSSYMGRTFDPRQKAGEIAFRVKRLPLSAGVYKVGARVLANGMEADWPADSVGTLNVEAGDFFGTGNPGFGSNAPLLLDGRWELAE